MVERAILRVGSVGSLVGHVTRNDSRTRARAVSWIGWWIGWWIVLEHAYTDPTPPTAKRQAEPAREYTTVCTIAREGIPTGYGLYMLSRP